MLRFRYVPADRVPSWSGTFLYLRRFDEVPRFLCASLLAQLFAGVALGLGTWGICFHQRDARL